MLRKRHIIVILVIGFSLTAVLSLQAQEDLGIPQWVKNNALWWGQGSISDSDFMSALSFLIEKKLITVPSQDDYSQKLQSKIIALQDENQKLKKNLDELKKQNTQSTSAKSSSYYDPAPKSSRVDSQSCSGYAACFSGQVTQVIDGDTIAVDGDSIRFALVNTPEIGEYGYGQARDLISKICPPGSTVLVDEDDLQTQGSYGRMIGVVYCNGMNLNKVILDYGYGEIDTFFCSQSEFANHAWAYACAAKTQEYVPPKTKTEPPKSEPPKSEPPKSEPPTEPAKSDSAESNTPSCDPSYPDFCIPPPPPDLDCGDISQKRFTVLQPDPHRFDGDKDGIGCES
jgi:micrococcal nuclease